MLGVSFHQKPDWNIQVSEIQQSVFFRVSFDKNRPHPFALQWTRPPFSTVIQTRAASLVFVVCGIDTDDFGIS